ncbi:hypothetical protein B0H13DRAFT_2679254 [Mycena leptocephala]|nr:hypothetical protein B0H13DRAFT_2679254 [Mycena leptocephala]
MPAYHNLHTYPFHESQTPHPASDNGQYSTSKWLWLLLNAVATTAFGVALTIFVWFKVPITWALSQLGQQYPAATNVVLAAEHYAAAALHSGITMDQWAWLQALAKTKIYPSLDGRHKRARIVWILLIGTMGAHTASLVAIFQPQPYYQNVLYNDTIPCGVDPSNLTFTPSPQIQPAQADLDEAALRIGLQLGSYYGATSSFAFNFNFMFNDSKDPIDGNATTSVSGRSYVKDNFGYGAVGGLVNGLQELPGVSITAQCSGDRNTSSSLWNSAFPGLGLPIGNITNGTGSFLGSLTSSPTQAVITSTTPFNLTGSKVAMYGVVNASGSGAVLTVGAAGDIIVCTWSALPQLVLSR